MRRSSTTCFRTSVSARGLLVHRACKAGEILRLKPGLFVLGQPYRRSEPHPFVVAAMLHAPSHISLEGHVLKLM